MINGKANIFILDGSKTILQNIKNILTKAAFNVITSNNSDDFFNSLSKSEANLILLDVLLPDIKGYEICKQLKSNSKYNSIPIVFLTSNTNNNEINKGLKCGAVDFITKPINEDLLILRVNNILNQYKQQEKYNSLFAKMNSGSCLLEAIYNKKGIMVDTKYLDVNPAYEKFINLKKKDIIGKTTLELAPSSEQSWFDKFSEMMRENKSIIFEMYHANTNKWYATKSYPVEHNTFVAIFEDITENKKNEQEINEANQELDLIFENSPISHILINENYEVLKLNHSAENLIKKNIKSYRNNSLPGDILNCINVSDNKAICGKGEVCKKCVLRKTFKSTFDSGKSNRKIETQMQIKVENKLKTIHVLISTVPIYTKNGKQVLISIDDITQRRIAEIELEKSSKLFETVLNTISGPLVLKDLEGNIKYVNKQFEKEFNIKSENLVGKSDYKFHTHKDSNQIKLNDERVLKERETLTVIEKFHFNDGTLNYYLVKKSPTYNAKNEIDGICSVAFNITTQKQLENELIKSEENYRFLFNNMNEAFAVHKLIVDEKNKYVDFEITEANSAFLQLFGLKKDQTIFKRISRVFPNFDKTLLSKFEKVALTGVPMNFTNYLEELDKYIEINAFCPKKGYLATTLNDITEKTKYAIKLKESEEKYRLLIDNQSDLVVKVNTKGEYLFVSPSFCHLYNKTEKELIGSTFYPLIHKDDLEITNEVMSSLHNPPYNAYLEQRSMTKDGWKWIAWQDTSVLNHKNEVIEIIGVGRDITQKKNSEKALHEVKNEQVALNKALKETNLELIEQKKQLLKTQDQLIQSEKMASLGILSAGVAHEINNPLNYISSGLIGLKKCNKKLIEKLNGYRVLDENDLIEQYKSYKTINNEIIDETIGFSETMIQSIEDGIKKTTGIVGSLGAFSKKSEKLLSKIDINQTIDSVLVILNFSYKYKIEIVKSYCKEGFIIGNSGKLHQIFMNILSNAIQAIQSKGTIYISTKWNENNDKLIVKIKDTGVGIPAKIKNKIYDPFFSTKQVGKGTGLGLYITYNIIEQHKGTINFISEKDKGTEFTISLPKNQ